MKKLAKDCFWLLATFSFIASGCAFISFEKKLAGVLLLVSVASVVPMALLDDET